MTSQSHCWAYTPRKPELRDTCTPMFIAALFIIARTWKQYRLLWVVYASADKRIINLWYIYTMEYYSAIKRNTFESVLMRWMNLEPIIESKSERERKKSYSNAYIHNLEKLYQRIYLQGRNGETDIENRIWTWREGRKG